MQNPISLEIDFRLNRLSIRLDRLGKHFEQLASEVRSGEQVGLSLKTLQECKLFIEWTGIDLEVDRAYELLQMQSTVSAMATQLDDALAIYGRTIAGRSATPNLGATNQRDVRRFRLGIAIVPFSLQNLSFSILPARFPLANGVRGIASRSLSNRPFSLQHSQLSIPIFSRSDRKFPCTTLGFGCSNPRTSVER